MVKTKLMVKVIVLDKIMVKILVMIIVIARIIKMVTLKLIGIFKDNFLNDLFICRYFWFWKSEKSGFSSSKYYKKVKLQLKYLILHVILKIVCKHCYTDILTYFFF